MRREDLFEAIGQVEESRLVRCEVRRNPPVNCKEDSKVNIGKYPETGKPRRGKGFWLIAAAVTLMTLLMGSAIAGLIEMRVEKVNVAVYRGETQQEEPRENGEATEKGTGSSESTAATEFYEGERVVFEDVKDVFLELKPIYPQALPEGYAISFVSDGAPYQEQSIVYENGTGGEIRYLIFIGDSASIVEIYGIENKRDVKINGQDGILYVQTGGSRTLVWVDREQGFGFTLSTGDSSVDLLAMAESTREGEYLIPTRSEATVKAVKELGDYHPQYLPEGFVEQGTMGSPLENGGGWYSYVRKWFVNREENKKIYLEYESYRIVTEEGYSYDPEAACACFMHRNRQGEIEAEEIQVNGMFGYVRRSHIAWADPHKHVVFHLYSEDLSGEELLEVARSVFPAE